MGLGQCMTLQSLGFLSPFEERNFPELGAGRGGACTEPPPAGEPNPSAKGPLFLWDPALSP